MVGIPQNRAVAEKGTLYVVATPIGNLQDVTLRAIDILKTVDLIASEDTRRTVRLLSQYSVQTKQVPYHDHNKERQTPRLLQRLLAGESLAVVSDAGTPGISDPGYYLVRACLAENIEVVSIPGASSMLAALVISGLPTDRFCFEGFLPKAKGKLKKRLVKLADDCRTLVFFESPYRILKTLKAMLETFGDRPAFVGRELTKKFEQTYRDRLHRLVEVFETEKPRGEFVIIIGGKRE